MTRLTRRAKTDRLRKKADDSHVRTIAESEDWAERTASRIRDFTANAYLPRHRSDAPVDSALDDKWTGRCAHVRDLDAPENRVVLPWSIARSDIA